MRRCRLHQETWHRDRCRVWRLQLGGWRGRRTGSCRACPSHARLAGPPRAATPRIAPGWADSATSWLSRQRGCRARPESGGRRDGSLSSRMPQDVSETQIGLITNFPNWHYTTEHPGMLGSFTVTTGVHYHDVLDAVYGAARKKGTRFDFVEVDLQMETSSRRSR